MVSSHHWLPIFVMSHNDVVVAANSSLLPVIHPPTRLPHHMEKSKARREKIKDQLDSCDARHLVFLSYAYLHLNVVTWMTKAEKNGEISSTLMSTVVAYRRFHDLCCWSWRTPPTLLRCSRVLHVGSQGSCRQRPRVTFYKKGKYCRHQRTFTQHDIIPRLWLLLFTTPLTLLSGCSQVVWLLMPGSFFFPTRETSSKHPHRFILHRLQFLQPLRFENGAFSTQSRALPHYATPVSYGIHENVLNWCKIVLNQQC